MAASVQAENWDLPVMTAMMRWRQNYNRQDQGAPVGSVAWGQTQTGLSSIVR